jgi:hypothetical protein
MNLESVGLSCVQLIDPGTELEQYLYNDLWIAVAMAVASSLVIGKS